jgi:Glycine zipper
MSQVKTVRKNRDSIERAIIDPVVIDPTRERTVVKVRYTAPGLLIVAALLLTSCAGGPLSTREKGAGIGALGGAAAGGLIGAAVGHPGAGAAIGGGLGLGAGALIGDQFQGHENTNYRQQQQIQSNQNQINRNRRDIERLKAQQGEY